MTWKRGDLALCVNDGPPSFSCIYPVEVRKGRIYTVSSVVNHPVHLGLRFKEFRAKNPAGHNALRFLRIPPLTREERDEFLTDLDFDLDVLHLRNVR